MNATETRNLIEKLVKYSMEELEMAEKYQKLMNCVEDSSSFTKFKEFANQELAHHDYDISLAMTLAEKMKDDGNIQDVNDMLHDIFMENQNAWKDKIAWKIANAKLKTSR